MKTKTRWLAALLALVMLLGLAGCQLPHPMELIRQLTHQEEAEAKELGCDITWRTAFRDFDLPAGGMMKDEVAFARRESGAYVIENVSRDTLAAYDDGGYLPHYSTFKDCFDPELELLIRCISYAFSHRCQRFVLPMNGAFSGADREAYRYFRWSTDAICTTRVSSSTVQEDGSTLYYCLCVLNDTYVSDGYAAQHEAAFDKAKQIVASIPSTDTTDYDKALYLYNYLTENVRYAYEEDFPAGEDYYTYALNLYYDTLINQYTVCSGYGKTFAWLCELAGIAALPVTGQYSETEGHLWAMARIDGDCYWFDATYDLEVPPEYYQFFGISDEELKLRDDTRQLDQEYEGMLPACPACLPLPAHVGPAKEELTIERGTVSDHSYRNDSLGLACELSTRWSFMDDTEIGQGSGAAWTPMDELLADDSTVFDMVAYTDYGEELEVVVKYLSGSERLLTEEETADGLLEELMALQGALRGHVLEQEFCGRSCQAVSFCQTYEGIELYQHYVLYRVDSYLVMVVGMSYRQTRAEMPIGFFHAPDLAETPTSEQSEQTVAPAA